MTFLYVLAGIFCLLLFLLLLRIRVTITYEQEVSARLHILFFRFSLYPRKKKVKIRRYTYRRYRKRLEKQRKKQAPAKQAVKAEKPTTQKKKLTLKDNLTLYTTLVSKLYKRFLHHFRIDMARLHITVATGDAAETAILTGIAYQGVAYLLEVLRLHTNFHTAYRKDILVIPDYLGERSSVDCKLSFSLRIFEILDLGIRFFFHFLTGRLSRQKNQNTEEKPWQKAN